MIGLAEPGDVVVIAGKGHEQGQEIAGETLPFDDREVAREALPLVIPLALDDLRALGLGDARRATATVTGVQIDSRRVAPGDLFVAVGRGSRVRGRRTRRAAPRPRSCRTTRSPRSRRSRGSSATARSARVVGITGSTGKTSTKDILAALCAPVARTVASEASFNNELGVPLTLCRLEPETELLLVEMGMRGFGQIAELCGYVRPDVGVITAVGPAHLELVGDVAGVARAKGELLAALPAGGVAVVPSGVPELRAVSARRPRRPRRAAARGRPGRAGRGLGDDSIRRPRGPSSRCRRPSARRTRSPRS